MCGVTVAQTLRLGFTWTWWGVGMRGRLKHLFVKENAAPSGSLVFLIAGLLFEEIALSILSLTHISLFYISGLFLTFWLGYDLIPRNGRIRHWLKHKFSVVAFEEKAFFQTFEDHQDRQSGKEPCIGLKMRARFRKDFGQKKRFRFRLRTFLLHPNRWLENREDYTWDQVFEDPTLCGEYLELDMLRIPFNSQLPAITASGESNPPACSDMSVCLLEVTMVEPKISNTYQILFKRPRSDGDAKRFTDGSLDPNTIIFDYELPNEIFSILEIGDSRVLRLFEN